MYRAMDVAKKIIEYSVCKKKEVSNLMLQKLLYYTQAAFLVEKNCRCFSDPIVAWAFGPVVIDVYKAYRYCGREAINEPVSEQEMVFDKNTMKISFKDKSESINESDFELIKKVVDSYGEIQNPFELVKKTHEEAPWKNTKLNDEILSEVIKEYYLKNNDKLYYKGN